MNSRSLTGLAMLAGCATAAPPAPAPPPPPPEPVVAEEPAPPVPTRPRYDVRPLRPTQAFMEAVQRGTRTAHGQPGPRYWQQQVEYRIDAELDPATAVLQGAAVITYTNHSPDTLSSVLLHVYQNAFAPGVPRVRTVPITGGVKLQRIAVDDVVARRSATSGPSWDVEGTLLGIRLGRPLAPGGTVELQLDWQFRVPPPGAPRTGHADHEAYVVAQWYPQVAVYDDLRGWHDTPYWTNGEFYLEYASFDVTLTLPEGWLVAATGELKNAAEVLTPEVRARLGRVRTQNGVVRVVTTDDVEQGTATVREPGGHLTWLFAARDVRDFAFAASSRYVWDATRALLPDADGDGDRESVLVHALYRPGTAAWENAARYMRHAITYHADRYGAYIYPHITAAEGPIGGMEYPMLVFIGGARSPQSLYSVLSHEIAHEWWPMMVGSNETHYAWQDEGLASYAEDLSLSDFFDGERPALATQESYLAIAGSDVELPIMTRPDLFGVGPQYGVAAYTKPATLLRALEGVIGPDTVRRGLHEYTSRWRLKHPAPYDFFNVIEDVAGRDLDWFWSPWFHSTAVLDQAIADVRVEPMVAGERVTVVVADSGDAPMPVNVVLTLAGGETRVIRLPVEPWLDGRVEQILELELPARLVRVEIDPARLFPDVDRDNNVWIRR